LHNTQGCVYNIIQSENSGHPKPSNSCI